MKAAIVDLTTGVLVSKRHRISTPQPATPAAMADVVGQLIDGHAWSAPAGRRLPVDRPHGVVGLAANIDRELDGGRRRRAVHAGVRAPRDDDQRCRCRRDRRDAVRGRAWPRRCRHHADVRYGDRVRSVRRRHARAEHRTRAPRARRARCRDPGVGGRSRTRGPRLARVGPPGRALPASRRDALLARPVHRRRGCVEGRRTVVAAHLDRDRHRSRDDGEQRRNRRRRTRRPPQT